MIILTNMNHKPNNCWECKLKNENGDCLLIKDSEYLYYFDDQYEQCPIEEQDSIGHETIDRKE